MVSWRHIPLIAALSFPAVALAQPSGGSDVEAVSGRVIRHTPPVVVDEGSDLYVTVHFAEAPFDDVEVILWVEGGEAVPLRTTGGGWFRGRYRVPADADEVAYAIELRDGDDREAVFASRAEPHRVLVVLSADHDVVEQLDRDAQGRRHELSAGFGWWSFGDGPATRVTPNAAGLDVPQRIDMPDWMWTTQVGYRYRFHRTVHHLGVGVAAMRGAIPADGPDDPDLAARDYNLVTADLALRWWQYGLLTLRPAVGFTADGATGGGDASLRFGRIYGSGVTVGGGWLKDLGGKFFAQVELGGAGTAVPWLRVGSTFTATDMPSPGRWGLRATADAAIQPGAGLTFRLRGGYQARMAGPGGPVLGGGVSYAF